MTDDRRAKAVPDTVRERHHTVPETVTDEMCPNCVTPWKCNGPHEPVTRPTGKDVCAHDGDDWPCDAIQEADKAAALLVRAQELSARLDEAGAYRVDAEADADRLAEALRRLADVHSTVLLRTTHPRCCQYVDDHGPDCYVGQALRQHEAPREDHR